MREDELYGKARGDELPEALRRPEGRRQAFADAKRRIQERKERAIKDDPAAEMEVDLEAVVLARPVLRRGGRREWFGVARRELDAHRARQARRFRATATTGASKRWLAWRKAIGSSWTPTTLMSDGARRPGTRRAGC